jgi:hypothetical protein
MSKTTAPRIFKEEIFEEAKASRLQSLHAIVIENLAIGISTKEKISLKKATEKASEILNSLEELSIEKENLEIQNHFIQMANGFVGPDY